MRRLEFAEHVEEGVREAEGRADQLAGGTELEGLLHHLHRVERTMDDGVAIDENETALGLGAHGVSITLASCQLFSRQSCP